MYTLVHVNLYIMSIDVYKFLYPYRSFCFSGPAITQRKLSYQERTPRRATGVNKSQRMLPRFPVAAGATTDACSHRITRIASMLLMDAVNSDRHLLFDHTRNSYVMANAMRLTPDRSRGLLTRTPASKNALHWPRFHCSISSGISWVT